MRNYSALISTTFWLPILLIYFQNALWKCLYFIADNCYFYDIDLPISLIHFPLENMNVDLFQMLLQIVLPEGYARSEIFVEGELR